MLLNQIKKEEKIKRSCVSNLVYSKDSTFYKYHNTEAFIKHSFYSKQNDLNEFKDKSEIFQCDTKNIKPNNEAQTKDFEKRKVLINTAPKLYNNLLEDLKKRVNILNKPEMLILDFDRDDLPPMPALEGDEVVKSEPQDQKF